jgi:hypothetical protein
MMTNSWKLNEGPPARKGELVVSSSMKDTFAGGKGGKASS